MEKPIQFLKFLVQLNNKLVHCIMARFYFFLLKTGILAFKSDVTVQACIWKMLTSWLGWVYLLRVR